MSSITTHVLDTARGRPADDVAVTLSIHEGDGWREIGGARTDRDGRVAEFPGAVEIAPGMYRLRFATGEYQKSTGGESFWPHVDVVFVVAAGSGHHHVPLLLSPFGYATYRGS